MKRLYKKVFKSKKPSLGLIHGPEPATSTSTLTTNTTAFVPSVPASDATARALAQVNAGVSTTVHNLGVSTSFSPSNLPPTAHDDFRGSTSISALAIAPATHEHQVSAPVSTLAVASAAHPEEDSVASRNAMMQANLRNTVPEHDPSAQQSKLGFFANAQNPVIIGSSFVINNVSTEPVNTGGVQISIPATQKPNCSPFFTGRRDVLDRLEKKFTHQVTSRCSCLLWGMGGIGKTQICLKFIEEMAHNFSHLFWIDASSEESMEMSLRSISSLPAAQYSGVDDSVGSVLQWISFLKEEWLIVFDNADAPHPDAVERFIPPGNQGNILITSRNGSMGRIVSFENSIEIKEMEEVDAITLLLKASHLDPLLEHLEVSKMIVNELYCIPLAINQAGAYIESGKCDIDHYLRQFSVHRQALMSDVTFTGASKYSRTVYGTWDLSFKEIEKRAGGHSTPMDAQAAQAAISILQICAFYHHTNISKDIFRYAAEKTMKQDVKSDIFRKLPQAATLLYNNTLLGLDNDGHWDEFIFGQGISVLLSFSLMKREHSSKTFSVHPLVHYWSRERMSKSEQQRMCEMGSAILSCAISWRNDIEEYRLQRIIFPHIKANKLYERQIEFIKQYYDDKWSKFALVLGENGDLNNAEQLEVQVMNMRKKLLGVEHPGTLTSMANLANIYENQGRWDKAEQLQVQVMEMRKKLLGAEHPDTLASMASLASIYVNQGRRNHEAEQLDVQIVEIRKKLLGAEHPDTLTSMANLACTYWSQGRWNEAEQLNVQVMELRKKLLGAEHPHTLTNMANLSSTYRKQGRWNEAEQLDVQVMEMRKKLLGAEHPNTLISMGNLANTYWNQGRWNEAEQLQVQVMEMTKKLLGVEHPDTLTSMANLACTYEKQGKLDEAEQLEIQVMEIRKKLLGAEHPSTLTTMGNLASTYMNQGRWNEAEQLDVQVMEISKKRFGAEHPDTLTSMTNLASTYRKQGKWNEAEQLDVQVVEMRKKLLGAEHPNTFTSMGNIRKKHSWP